MTQIVLINPVDQNHVAEVKAEMEKLGPPTIFAANARGHILALTGAHRITAAAELGLPIRVSLLGPNTPIGFNLSVADYVDGFPPEFPQGLTAVEVEVILTP